MVELTAGLAAATQTRVGTTYPPSPPPPPQTISSRIWPSSLEQGVWPADYNISDHGSLTASFRVAQAPATVTVVPTSKRQEEAVPVSPAASVSSGAEEDDDGHYGLR